MITAKSNGGRLPVTMAEQPLIFSPPPSNSNKSVAVDPVLKLTLYTQ